MGVVALLVLVAGGGFSGILLTNDPFYKRNDIASIPLGRLLAVAYIVFSLVMAAPLAITGRAVMAFQPWAKTVGMLLSAANMLSFPIGTAIGVYALWVLNDEATEFLFENSRTTGAKH